ncbi:MAG: hypothetical protein Q8K69_00370 [Bacteroidota bacterium]|nr:hypothetical protein [Bacteroidota bacterium]
MRAISLFILLFFFGINSFAQKMAGYGAELSVLSFKPNVRIWTSKTTGFELFTGLSSELNSFKPNDIEAGFKFLRTIIYNRTDRTYFGVVGKWKWAKVDKEEIDINTSLPVVGLLIGKEWYSKRINLKGYAVELGYQYGVKEYPIPKIDRIGIFEEFPLILNLRYSFYKKR